MDGELDTSKYVLTCSFEEIWVLFHAVGLLSGPMIVTHMFRELDVALGDDSPFDLKNKPKTPPVLEIK